MGVALIEPLQKAIDDMEVLINGKDDSGDPSLRSALRDVTSELKADSESLQRVFDGKDGLLKLGPLLAATAISLKKAGDTIANSKVPIQKFSAASDNVSKLSESFTKVGKLLEKRPQALIWGPGRNN
jgi:hypothetical protein